MRGVILVVFAAIMVSVYAGLGVVCPKPIFGEISAAPHPCNCSVYYECRNNGSEKIAKICPSPFVFNADAQTCDWPQRANCKVAVDCFSSCKCTFSY